MLPRLLFRLAAGVSLLLILLVVVSPFLHDRVPQASRWSRVLTIFARDPTLRRTAIAGAIGLTVTACVFFRPPTAPRRLPPRQRTLPPPPDMAGA